MEETLMTKDLLILSTQRSGTHFLTSLLNAGAKIKGFGEVFADANKRQKFYQYLEAEQSDLAVDDVRSDAKVFHDVFDRFLAHNKAEHPGNAFSFILMYNQARRLSDAVLTDLFSGRNIIHLVRRNVLRTHVSDFINRNRLKPTHSRDSAVGEATVKILLPTDVLVTGLETRAAAIDHHRKFIAQFDHTELHYEDLSEDNDLLRGLAEKFGFEAVSEFATGFKKTNPQPLSEIVENFEDVQAVLRGTPFFDLTQA